MTGKPPCRDFIIAAIRAIRRKPTHMGEGVAASAPVRELWNVALEIYSNEEVQKAFDELVREEEIVLSAKLFKYERREGVKDLRTIDWELLLEIPKDWPDGKEYFTPEYSPIDSEDASVSKFIRIRRIVAHVVADGLPQRTKTLMEKKSKKRAQKILESMKQKPA